MYITVGYYKKINYAVPLLWQKEWACQFGLTPFLSL